MYESAQLVVRVVVIAAAKTPPPVERMVRAQARSGEPPVEHSAAPRCTITRSSLPSPSTSPAWTRIEPQVVPSARLTSVRLVIAPKLAPVDSATSAVGLP